MHEKVNNLINYIDEIPEYTVIFILIKAYADSRKKLTQAIINNESLVSFTSFSNNDAIKWIIREVNKTKKQIIAEQKAAKQKAKKK